jgi:HTH-type transcriptional regulator / antitoxin HipB
MRDRMIRAGPTSSGGQSTAFGGPKNLNNSATQYVFYIIFKEYELNLINARYCLKLISRVYDLKLIVPLESNMILKTIKDFGLALREARRSKRLTQSQLAEKLGTNQEWISHLETGRIDNPSLGTILRAFATLGIDLNADTHPRSSPDEPFDTGDLALDEPSFLKGPGR